MDLSTATEGRLELTVKISTLPTPKPIKDGWQTIVLKCDSITLEATVRPKVWAKLTQAAKDWPQWVAAITGKVGQLNGTHIVLAEPAIQVFEKKPKAAGGDAAAAGQGGAAPSQ
jgi:hypothetical protein